MANNYLRGVLGFKGSRGYSAYEIAVQNGYKGSEKDWLATLGTSSHFEKKSEIIEATEGQTEFAIPEYYTSNSFIDVYVEGEHLDSTEYTLDTTTNKITLTNGVIAGTKVEIITLTMSTNSLPIVENLTESSTNETVLGAKSLFKLLPANVKNFGAIGDGITDDTEAIQNAINFCYENKRPLAIPSGTYRTNTLIIKCNIKGENNPIILFNSGEGFKNYEPDGSVRYDITNIEGITFESDKSSYWNKSADVTDTDVIRKYGQRIYELFLQYKYKDE